ncbi:MAG: hypothetical protein A2675_00390 [Candidatus Yonathbacteria bacterium RIFCSPHIGHO2_01_FULL_51_10]|uniref:Thioredoxin domain-containing protein n=1 Tax=Candidatus Yonathbacteria bacterium RIFCSPHIGHO2_01_FULL_51_10 TaxID=1802723 RepID=A0A1G2SB40_9BACT|nr:MAG: hypothetical protein A2675_00390 [Candidatus Yonathbacteria bacterium RIFCSPHIGHO2_01_FULL_51_10]
MDQESTGGMPSAPKNTSMAIPIAIVIAGLFIGGAIFISNGGVKKTAPPSGDGQATLAPITAKDHIRGNPNAPVKIVEYSDPECPYCKQFHTTLQQIMKDYGTQGNVALVYRHFPLDRSHPKSRTEINALECAGDVGGPEKFWEYLDRLFEVTPSNNGLDLALLPTIATDIGLDKTAFTACQEQNKFTAVIQADYESGIAAGVRGTPYSVVIGRDGTQYPINGADPYEAVRAVIDQALK